MRVVCPRSWPVRSETAYRPSSNEERSTQRAFTERAPADGPQPAVQQVHFRQSQQDPTQFLRVGIWLSRNKWERFQGSERQQEFWANLQRPERGAEFSVFRHRPYVWVKTADEILASLARYCARVSAAAARK